MPGPSHPTYEMALNATSNIFTLSRYAMLLHFDDAHRGDNTTTTKMIWEERKQMPILFYFCVDAIRATHNRARCQDDCYKLRARRLGHAIKNFAERIFKR